MNGYGCPSLLSAALWAACPAVGADALMDYMHIQEYGPVPAAPPPTPPDLRAGYDAFVIRCGLCHAVRGTAARSRFGPDLTHLMSRRRIGAGLLPNTVGNLGGWVADAQALKPGCFMPAMELPGPELLAILHYLQTLR